MSFINQQLKNKFIKQKPKKANLVWLKSIISATVVFLFIASTFLAYSYSLTYQNKNQNQNNNINQNIATNSIANSSSLNKSSQQENSSNASNGVKSDICSKVNYADDKANVLPEYLKYYEKNKSILTAKGDFEQTEIYKYSADEFANYYFNRTTEKLSKDQLKNAWGAIITYSRQEKNLSEIESATNDSSITILKDITSKDVYFDKRIADFTISAAYKAVLNYSNKSDISVADTIHFNRVFSNFFANDNKKFNIAIAKNYTQLLDYFENLIESDSENSNEELSQSLWQNREIFSLNKSNYKNFNVNNLYQLGLCRLKADLVLSKRNISIERKYEYLNNYNYANESIEQSNQKIDKLINLGYTKDETEYKELIQNYYTENLNKTSFVKKSSGFEDRILPPENKSYKQLQSEFIDLIPVFYQEMNSLFRINANEFFTNQEHINSKEIVIKNYKTCLEEAGVEVIEIHENSFAFKYKIPAMLLYKYTDTSDFSIGLYNNLCEKNVLDAIKKNVDAYLSKVSLSGLANESKFKDDNLF